MVAQQSLNPASVLLAVGLLTAPDAVASGAVEVTYLANEGFLLSQGDTKVLIDGLFPGIQGYPEPPEQMRRAMAAGRPPFDGVDLVLATHFHADHFGAREVGGYLRAHSGVQFVSTVQAIEALVKELGELPGNARSIYPEEVRPLGLAEIGIDLALLPAWYLAESRWLPVVAEIRAARIAAMHLASPDAPSSWFGSAGSRAARVRLIKSRQPEAWIPDTPMESRSYPAASGTN